MVSIADDTQLSDVATVSNVRQDLTEWQAKHANLVLSTVQVALLFLRPPNSDRGLTLHFLKGACIYWSILYF